MNAQNLPPQQPMMPLIAPVQNVCPTPTSIGFASAMVDGKKLIIMQVGTSSGVQFYFLEDAAAREIAKHLTQMTTGILLPPT